MADRQFTLPQHLASEQAFRQVLDVARQVNEFHEIDDSKTLARELNQRLAEDQTLQSDQELRRAYSQVVRYFQYVHLHTLDDKGVLELFRHHLLEGLASDIDLKTKLELVFLTRNDDLLERAFRRQVLRALSENDETIGRRGLSIPELPGTQPPQVQYWLVDFLRTVSAGKTFSALEVASYLNANPNVKTLQPDERQLLEQLLTLYTFIVAGPIHPSTIRVIRSFVASAPTSERPARAVPTAGAAAPPETFTPVVQEDFRSYLLQGLFEESAMEDAIDAEEQRLLAGGYRYPRIVEELNAGLATGNVPQLAGALFVLARSGDLPHVLEREPKIQQYVEREAFPSMLPALKEQKANVTLQSLIDDFRRQPGRIVYLKSFLERALTKAVGGDQTESARLGVRIASVLFQEGVSQAATMAFFDAGQRQYRWAKVGLDSQGVPMISE
ncbi:MAG: hypothetical protein HYZ09_04395 [Candidatus Kerfeldbacteria bacterium]|nr:hypothetical protein [Candidatus Kerfeldbacteria bacterium]